MTSNLPSPVNKETTRDAVEESKSPVEHATTPTRRVICPRCERPQARACLCAALPDQRLALQHCHVLALQHPHEIKRKNRSLFLAEFCLTVDSITRVRTRRWQPGRSSQDLARLLAPERRVWLIYPHAQAKSLSQALEERQQQSPPSPLTLIFLDATWKFAAEMERASQFPPHTQYIQLDADTDLCNLPTPKRFDIRTPPSPAHLSTAECLALVVSRVEGNPLIYDTIMKPLDLMVAQWHSFANNKKPVKDQC